MAKRNIIVIGASAGGFEAVRTLAASLPAGLDASIFVVWHMSPAVRGVLPEVLNRDSALSAAHAYDNEAIEPGRIYVAPPDHHMLVEEGRIRITHGPKENRFRPAVDPLFRSAAYTYGPRVIGVILSGALDDGTSGLWSVKHRGGLAIVQDPADAEVSSMPENAIREVKTDFIVPLAELAPLPVRLSQEEIAEPVSNVAMDENKKIEAEIRIAAEDNAFEVNIMQFGSLSPFTCPECHGVLTKPTDGALPRFRCHTGHAFSGDSLLAAVTENIEDSLWSAIRGVDESVMLLNHIGDHFAEVNNRKLAALYFRKAQEANERSRIVRTAVLAHEQLSNDKVQHGVDEDVTS